MPRRKLKFDKGLPPGKKMSKEEEKELLKKQALQVKNSMLEQQTKKNIKDLNNTRKEIEKNNIDVTKELKVIKKNNIDVTKKLKIILKDCDDENIKSLANIIEQIHVINVKSYKKSTNVTEVIKNLETISLVKNDLIKNNITNINTLINQLKQIVIGKDDLSTVGLSKSYLNILGSIKTYAETIKCPKKEESLDDIINYFYKWAKTNISVYNIVLHKMDKSNVKKNKRKFPFPQIIFPLYIIIKIILHRNLYNSSGSQSSRTRYTKDNINITEYLKPRLNENYLKSIFTPFFDLYFKNKLKNKSKKKVDTSINPTEYPIKPPDEKNFKEHFERPYLITFIDNFENLLKKLIVIDEKEFKTHFDTDENKTFKNHFYESILSQQYYLIGPHFSFGGGIPQPNFPHPPSGFRTLFNAILRRRLTNVDNFKHEKKEDENSVKSQRKALIARIKQLNDNTRPLRVGPLELGPKINNNNNKTNNSQTRKNSRYGQPALKQNKTQRLRAKTPNVEKRYRYPAWTEKDENNNKRFARKNNPSPPRSRKKSNNKTKKNREDEKLQTLLGRNKTKGLRAKTPQGMGDVEDETAKFFANQLKKNKILKTNKGGGKKKKHTKRNKKRHNKNKYTKKNK